MKTVDDKELEIYEYEGPGYEPTMNYQSWRVAIANPCDRFDKDKFERIESHELTDEVFVLLMGKASLVIGKNPVLRCGFHELPENVYWKEERITEPVKTEYQQLLLFPDSDGTYKIYF